MTMLDASSAAVVVVEDVEAVVAEVVEVEDADKVTTSQGQRNSRIVI